MVASVEPAEVTCLTGPLNDPGVMLNQADPWNSLPPFLVTTS